MIQRRHGKKCLVNYQICLGFTKLTFRHDKNWQIKTNSKAVTIWHFSASDPSDCDSEALLDVCPEKDELNLSFGFKLECIEEEERSDTNLIHNKCAETK